jgi:hypothetical protein
MYNRILNRPMFKLGGKTVDAQGTGITSGLDAPRQRYQFGEEVEKLSETIRVDPQDYRQATWEGVAGGFGDPSTKTLSEAVWKANMMRREGIKPLEASVAQQKFELSKLPLERQMAIDVGVATAEAGKRELDVHAKRKISEEADTIYRKAMTDYAGKDIPEHIQETYRSLKLLALGDEFYTIARATELAEKVFGTAEILGNWGIDDIADAKAAFIAMMTGNRWKTKTVEKDATGGRVGYQQGVGPNVMQTSLQENIKMPGEDVAISEQIDEANVPTTQAQGSGLGENSQAYALLRARLPQEITDDVVMLIAYNPQAFEDFAAIQTQSDVMSFNMKYGVELVIPAQEV